MLIKTTVSFIVFLLMLTSFSYGQWTDGNDEIAATFKEVSAFKPRYKGTIKVKNPRDWYTYNVVYEVESTNGEWIDVNKFSLVDHTNRLRFRPMFISSKKPGNLFVGFTHQQILHKDIYDKIPGANRGGINPESNTRDTFYDTAFEQYQVVDMEVNYGGINKPVLSSRYWESREQDFLRITFHFIIPKAVENPDLAFFYGKEQINPLRFEKYKAKKL